MSATLIIDTDPGIDDVVALALAARSPELEIAAVTTTYGNTSLANATRNARHVLRLAGRSDIPVFPGADRPLDRPLITAPETHGDTGVGYADVHEGKVTEARRENRGPGADGDIAVPPPRPNPTVLLDVLESTGPSTLVTLGPLTNLAHALRADRALVGARVTRHIGMFGNLHERGNTNRWADFNAWCDPEAADDVFRASLGTWMVGLDATRRMILDASEIERLRLATDPLVTWLADALRFYVHFHQRQERLDGCVVNDILTIGEILRPGLLAFDTRRLKIDTRTGETQGRTVEDPAGIPVAVALDVDTHAMRRLLDRVFGTAWDG